VTLFNDLILFLFVGFAVSFCFSWAFHWLQDSQNSAIPDMPEGVRQAFSLGLLFAAGPFVLAAHTADAQAREEWPDVYLAGGYALSALWGGVLGFAVTQIVIG
jgi:hypothetical protein